MIYSNLAVPRNGTSRAPSPTILPRLHHAAKSLCSLRIYVVIGDRIGGADFCSVITIDKKHNFCVLFLIISAPSRLSPNEALPQTPLGALPLDPTSPLAPGLSVRFISRFARCFILLYACNLLWSAMLIPHSSLLTPHSSLKLHSSLSSYCILILFKQSTLLGVEQLVNDIANSRSVQPTSLQKSIAFISKYLKSQT